MSDLLELTLTNVGGGAAEELFQHELKKILKNIQDVNTPPTAMRKITLAVTIVPTENREGAKISIDCNGKVANMKPAEGVLYFARRGPDIVALGANPTQINLDLDRPRVVKEAADAQP